MTANNDNKLIAEQTMNITLIPVSGSKEVTHSVIVGGQVVGDVSTYEGGRRLHAVLRVQSPGGGLGNAGLAQGFGDTPEEAISLALENGQREAQEYLAALAAMREQIHD